MASGQAIGRWLRDNPNRVIATFVALLIIGLSGWIGFRARAASKDLVARQNAWGATAAQLATVQQQFRVPTTTESKALLGEASRMSALGVTAEDKLNFVDMLGHLAEACDLSSVRVTVVPPADSAYIPDREIIGTSIKPATYGVAVEFVGRFADAQKFVSNLPPSVSLSRLSATRRESGALYQLLLSVYEIDGNPGD